MIEKGSNVRIESKENKTGSVVELNNGFARVKYDNKADWFPISELHETADELLNRLIKNDLDDEIDFVVAMDAYRLHVAQLWEPYVFASSNRIKIFPHQIDEVTWALSNSRTLIADEVGLGKTIVAALTSTELRARGLVNKALYVVPKSLILKWQDELEEKFQTSTKILSSSHQRIDEDTFKQDEFSYISSIDYLKQDQIKEYFTNTSLDLVIIDEAHKMKQGTNRLKLGKILAEKTNTLMLLTATPHDGRDDDFIERMKLLDPWITDVGSSSHLWVRNIKENVLDIDGKQVFPERTSTTVELKITPPEENIHTMLDEYMNRREAEAANPSEVNAVRFLRIIFKKRCSSSIRSLEISLNRRLEKLGTVDINDVAKYNANIQRLDGSEEDYDEDEFEKNLKNLEAYTADTNLDQEKRDLTSLLNAIKNLGGTDTKQQTLVDFIKNLKKDDTKAKLVLFTEYKDTLNSLYDRLSQTYKVGKIDGTMNIDERKKALDSFKQCEGEDVLLCTDAAGEGIDMQFCNIEINYDLPWNPNKLEQRMGRIHRIGQSKDVYYYNFVIDNEKSIDGYIFKKLLDKIEHIKEAMNGKIYDVLGRIISEEDISKLYTELTKVPYAERELKIKEFTEKIDANKERILRENEQLLTSNRFDKTKLENIQKIRKHAIGKGEIKRFIETYVGINEGDVNVINKDDDLYRISLPRKIAQQFDNAIIEGTFDGDVAIKKALPYLALGNKNISKIIEYAANLSVSCLTHETKSGLLSVYRFTVTNAKGITQNSRILGLFQNEDGKITEIDLRSLWSYEDTPKFEINTNLLIGFNDRSNAYARTELTNFEDETEKRISVIKKKSEAIARNYFATKKESLEEQIGSFEKIRSSGPHIEKTIKRITGKKAELTDSYNKKIASINDEFQIQSTLELVGLAWIVPGFDANIRTEIEKAGQDAVIRYEKKQAATPEENSMVKDVSDRDTGYDVESFGGKCIEVKSFKTTGSPKITSHEWETAHRMNDDYWLYIVENALDNPKITRFKNPYDRFKDTVRKEEVIEYRYIIDDWKQHT